MLCPFCQSEMTEGFVQSGREICFTTERKKWFLLTDENDISVSKNNWTFPACRAYHCAACKKVICDYTAELPE